MCASVWVLKTRARNESEEVLSIPVGVRQHRPIMRFVKRFELEHICWDPKDGELCLQRAKPGEILVEAPNGTDVQIVRVIWV